MDSQASGLTLKTMDFRDLKEKGYIRQKSIALLSIPLTTLSLERKKRILTSLAGYGKNPFLPLGQYCCNSSWGGLWAVLLQITEMKPQRSRSAGPQCDLVNIHFACSGGHFIVYLLTVLVQKAR